jgi:hypothetical protein
MLIRLEDYRMKRKAPAGNADQQAGAHDDARTPTIASSAAVVIFRRPSRPATERLAVSTLAGIYPLASRY